MGRESPDQDRQCSVIPAAHCWLNLLEKKTGSFCSTKPCVLFWNIFCISFRVEKNTKKQRQMLLWMKTMLSSSVVTNRKSWRRQPSQTLSGPSAGRVKLSREDSHTGDRRNLSNFYSEKSIGHQNDLKFNRLLHQASQPRVCSVYRGKTSVRCWFLQQYSTALFHGQELKKVQAGPQDRSFTTHKVLLSCFWQSLSSQPKWRKAQETTLFRRTFILLWNNNIWEDSKAREVRCLSVQQKAWAPFASAPIFSSDTCRRPIQVVPLFPNTLKSKLAFIRSGPKTVSQSLVYYCYT